MLQQLQAYVAFDSVEAKHVDRVLAFLQQVPQPFHRETQSGHITSSAIVVNANFSQILLLHHRKADRWLQPGGHCDGNANTLAVAQQEVEEETGLKTTVLDEAIFDVDVHPIPEWNDVPAHHHYDVRHLLVADDRSAFCPAAREVIAVRWFPIVHLPQFSSDESLRRVAQKLWQRAERRKH